MLRPAFHALALIVALLAIFVGSARLGAYLDAPAVNASPSAAAPTPALVVELPR
jgi:hypothetical protein